jgi:TRAP-type C4-dicarboxylate transport system permease small subunit
MIPKLILSVVAVIAVFWLGVFIFFVNPINWRTDIYWLNWPMILTNAAIVVGVTSGWWFSLRSIWKRSKKEPNQPSVPTRESGT